MGLIEFVPSREAFSSIGDSPEEMAIARETTRWVRETPQGQASMKEVVEFVEEMHRQDLAEQGIG